ncbi:precorrin-2 C(20)-methyltransferase [Acetobacter oeni]|uniref:precorrin-2 C(20)-methyltransferase n=1 Tax=Acetobacter oeni TaxID=304077 RepID=UPI0011BEC1B9|nr:precorrin-2 C(20)-methyltransferase [Acetobacter oeni]
MPDSVTQGCPAQGRPTSGRIICAGLGPGDPELMSVRADRLIRSACHVAYFRKAGRAGQARRIVEGMLAPGVIEHPMEYPVTTELPVDSPAYRDALAGFYDSWAARLTDLARTQDVVVLCEGDPFFYGSFMHLHTRLQGHVALEVVPGMTGMTGCWNVTGIPITWGDDVLTVLTGTMPEAELIRHMQATDALVVMKTGRNLPRVRSALALTGRLEEAWLIERGTMPGQRVIRLAEAHDDDCPYFAIVLVHGHGRRPERAQGDEP